jgi:crotonobetainyl-CoA:carnitine CoA-transferase CaiB-like acyl-CoA transferase
LSPVGALAGLRVVELGGGIAAGYATKLICDLGADVVKVEPPEGDELRRTDADLFGYLNAGKRSLVGDGANAPPCDLAITSGELLPAAGATLRISPFGQPGGDGEVTDLTLQAMGGWVSAHGIPGHNPVMVGGRLPEYVAGSYAACAALTAHRAAVDLAQPVHVELSMLECLVGTLAYPMLFLETLTALGLPPPDARYSVLPGIVRCRDGWAGINALTGQHWQDICVVMEADEFAGQQRQLGWGGPELAGFFARVQPWLDSRSVEEVVDLCQAMRIPAAPVGDGATLPQFAQFRERRFFTGTTPVVPGPPYRLSATPAGPAGPAPRLGERVVGGAAPPTGATVGFREGYMPLAGLRVIDLGTFWAGPYVGLYLGAMGADVIKLESVQRPDGFRFSAAFPQEGADWYERSGLWQATNLNKRGITLDLGRPEGVELAQRLVEGADVVIENFSARVVEQFSLGYEDVRRLRPDVIMVRMPGFGLEGPWRDYVGWAMAFEQASGMAQVTGAGSRPINPGGFLDPVVGMHGAVAVQAALAHRERTGEGQLIEIAQVEVGACLTAEQVIEHSLRGTVMAGLGNRHPRWAPQGVYRCAPDAAALGRLDGEWVALSVRDDREWAALVEAMGGPAWTSDVVLATVEGRRRAHDAIDAGLTEWMSGLTPATVVAILRPLGVPVATLLTAPLMYSEPRLAARSYYQAIEHPVTGTRRYPGWPMQFSFGPLTPHCRRAPTLGEHNDEVLGGLPGVGPDELAVLRSSGVIGERMLG